MMVLKRWERKGGKKNGMLEIFSLKVFDVRCFPRTKLTNGFMDEGRGKEVIGVRASNDR